MYVTRTEKERKRVPWAGAVTKRQCEEFQCWLLRGNYDEGDYCDWDEKEESGRDLSEVKRRREELMWKDRVGERISSGGTQSGNLVTSRDPLGLDEMDSGTGSFVGQLSTSDRVGGCDVMEELAENELNVSQQSLLTHIQMPTHTFCMNEAESDCTDYMEEVDDLEEAHGTVSESRVPPEVFKSSLPSVHHTKGVPSNNSLPPVKLVPAPEDPSVFSAPALAPLDVAQRTTEVSDTNKKFDDVIDQVEPRASECIKTDQGLSVLSALVGRKKIRVKLF